MTPSVYTVAIYRLHICITPRNQKPALIVWPYRGVIDQEALTYDCRKVTTYTTHQWYVVLEVFCVVYVGKPPTTHVGGVKWYVVLEVFCVVYVGKPPTTHVGKPTTTCRFGGLPTYTTQNTSNTTYHWCVIYIITFRPSY